MMINDLPLVAVFPIRETEAGRNVDNLAVLLITKSVKAAVDSGIAENTNN